MAEFNFNQHAKILREGQYRVEPKKFVVHAPRVFTKTKEQEIDESAQRIEDLREEIQNLEEEMADKIDASQQDAQEIIQKAEDEAQRIVKEAEEGAFDRVQKSLDDKDRIVEQKNTEGIDIVDKSKEEATQIVKEAKRVATKITDDAYQDGYKKGKREGFEFSKGEVQLIVDRLHGVISATIDERDKIMIHSERQIITLIITMVEKIVKKLTEEEKNLVINNSKAALSLIRGAMLVYIHVNPDDYNFTVEHKQELISMIEGMPNVKFFQNPKIGVGGVYIETDIGDIDATIATQLEEVKDKMKHYIPLEIKTKTLTEEYQDKLQEMKVVDSIALESSQIVPDETKLKKEQQTPSDEVPVKSEQAIEPVVSPTEQAVSPTPPTPEQPTEQPQATEATSPIQDENKAETIELKDIISDSEKVSPMTIINPSHHDDKKE